MHGGGQGFESPQLHIVRAAPYQASGCVIDLMVRVQIAEVVLLCPLTCVRVEGVDWGEGRTVDASAARAEEGRGRAAKRPGELRASGDPGVSEWGNLAWW